MRYSIMALVCGLLCSTPGCGGGGGTVPPPDPPRITAVRTVGEPGLPGTTLQFQADVEGPVTEWRWTFGPGVSLETAAEESPVVLLERGGDVNITVIAANAGGSSSAAKLTLSVPSPQRPSWNLVGTPVGEDSALQGAAFCVHDGRIYVSDYRTLAVAEASAPNLPTSWSIYQFEAPVGFEAMPVNVDGNLLLWSSPIDHGSGNKRPMIGFPKVVTPESPSDWDIVACSFAEDLILSFGKADPGWVLLALDLQQRRYHLLRTTLDQPHSFHDWSRYELSSEFFALFTSAADLTRVNSRWLVALTDYGGSAEDIYIGLSDDLTPEAVSNWTFYRLDTFGSGPEAVSLINLRDKPVLAYGGSQPTLRVALTQHPMSTSDWTNAAVGNTRYGSAIDVVEVQGRLLLSFAEELTGGGAYRRTWYRQTDMTAVSGDLRDSWDHDFLFENELHPFVSTWEAQPYGDGIVTLYFSAGASNPTLAFSDGPW